MKIGLCWIKLDWVAVCPEAEHLLSPHPVLMPEPVWDVPGWVWVWRWIGRGWQRDGYVLVDRAFAVVWEQLRQPWDQVGGLA